MKDDFDYSLVPTGYAFCLNAKCPQASKCLLHQLFLHAPSDLMYIKVINPAQVEAYTQEDACPYFKADTTCLFAIGMKHLFDSVPHKDAVIIKDQLLAYFGHSLFYRYWREERMFTPVQQEYVRKLFQSRGISSQPVFDRYVELYEW